MKRRILSMLLAVCMLITMLPALTTHASATSVPYTDLLLNINYSNITQVGYQPHYTNSCGCFAMAYCRTLLDGTVHNWYEYNFHTGGQLAGGLFDYNTHVNSSGWWAQANYVNKNFGSKAEAFQYMYNELIAGRPVVARVFGTYQTIQHYVAVVGFQNVTSLDSLSESNFLILDSINLSVSAGGIITRQNVESLPAGSNNYTLKLADGVYELIVNGYYSVDQGIGFIATGGCSHSYTTTETPATCTAAGSKTYTCTSCGDSYSETIPELGHNHIGVVTKPTCVSLGYTTYTCSRCSDSYVESGETVWSDWSTFYPDSIGESLIETQIQYRYRDREQNWTVAENGTLQYVPSWPSGFSTSHGLYAQYSKTPKTASETDSQRITVNSDDVIGYIYYHWCRGTYTAGPINRLVGKVCNGEFVTFHAFYSTSGASKTDGNGAYGAEEFYFSNADCCRDSYWYHQIPVRLQNYTIEEKQFDGERWGDWSVWGDTAYTASDSREIETRTVYRYPISGLADHSWDDGEVTKAPTETVAGTKTYTCTVCNETKTETIPASGGNIVPPTESNQPTTPPVSDNPFVDMTELYIPVVEQEINDVFAMWNNEDFLNSVAYGHLWDIDNDGVQELLISSQYIFSSDECDDTLYPYHPQQNVYSIYDIINNRVQTIAWKEPIIADTGSCYGYAGIVIYKGSPVVMTYTMIGDLNPDEPYPVQDCEVTLYDSINYEPFHTIKINTTEAEVTYFINGVKVTPDVFRQEMSQYTYLELVAEDELMYTNPTMTLPELLKYLKNPHTEDNKPVTPPVDDNPFVDVPSDAFYHDPVLWAVDNTVTNGIDATHFGPDAGCTRAHVVTFLWRAAGSPAPSSSYNPFTDVLPGSYYYDAVLWAVEKGITNGTSATTFEPDVTCTRGQIVTFLWRYQHSPSAPGTASFSDVPAGQYYSTAVAWAVENSITNGMGDGTFAPDATCTRGQIVTFLYRAMNK